MFIDKWLYETVKASPRQAAFAGDRIFRSGGTNSGEETPQEDSAERPFIILRAGVEVPQNLPGIIKQLYQVWLHIDTNSLAPVDDLATELKFWVPSQAGVKLAGGNVIMEARHEATSGDLPDDHFHTTARYVEFSITAKDAQPVAPAQ